MNKRNKQSEYENLIPSDIRFKHITESICLIQEVISEKLKFLENDEYEDLHFANKDLGELWTCVDKLIKIRNDKS